MSSAFRVVVRDILKDVVRTDRDLPFFAGDNNVHLTMMLDILATYAVFQPGTCDSCVVIDCVRS